jgi:hypothetical protein
MPMSAIGVMPIAPLVAHTHGILYVEPDGTSLQEQISNAVRAQNLGSHFRSLSPTEQSIYVLHRRSPSLVGSLKGRCLFGRDDDKKLISSEIQNFVESKQGALVVIKGDVGTGKSALVSFATSVASGAGLRCLTICGEQKEKESMLFVLHQLFFSLTDPNDLEKQQVSLPPPPPLSRPPVLKFRCLGYRRTANLAPSHLNDKKCRLSSRPYLPHLSANLAINHGGFHARRRVEGQRITSPSLSVCSSHFLICLGLTYLSHD